MAVRTRKKSGSLTQSRIQSLGISDVETIGLILFAFITMVFSLVSPNTMAVARMTIIDMGTPVLNTVTRPFQNIMTGLNNLSEFASLQSENDRLTNENERLRQWYYNALSLQAENKSLRELLNLKLPNEPDFITARLITDNNHQYLKSALIDAGEEDGIQEGDAVLSDDGLIGRIIQTGNHVSRILLITDINSRIPVLIADTLQHAILKGDNTELPTLDHVAEDTKIDIGSHIITSGHGGVFPYGLPIGSIISDTDGIYTIQPFAKMDYITFVKIAHKGEETIPSLSEAPF